MSFQLEPSLLSNVTREEGMVQLKKPRLGLRRGWDSVQNSSINKVCLITGWTHNCAISYNSIFVYLH